MKNVNHIQHKRSNSIVSGAPQYPTPSAIEVGELALNYAASGETIFLKNSNGVVVPFSSDELYSEKKLGSGFTGENSATTVTDAFASIERITSMALNDLNSRILGFDDKIGSGFSGYNLTEVIDENEKLTAIALNDLNARISGFSDELDNTEKVISMALNDLNYRVDNIDIDGIDFSEIQDQIDANSANISTISGKVGTGFSSYDTITDAVEGLYTEVDGISDIVGVGFSTSSITEVLSTIDLVASAALTNLDNRVNELSATVADKQDELISGTNIKTINGQSILGSGNITIEPNRQNNVIDTKGLSSAEDLEKISNALESHTEDKDIHVTTSQTSSWDAKADKSYVDSIFGTAFTQSRGDSITEVIEDNELAVTTALNSLSGTISTHSSNATIHVSSDEKGALDGYDITKGSIETRLARLEALIANLVNNTR